jgi:hypothetical protein
MPSLSEINAGSAGSYQLATMAPTSGTASEEAARAFAHAFRIAKAAGFKRSDIVYVDLAFIDLADVTEVNGFYGIACRESTIWFGSCLRQPTLISVKLRSWSMRWLLHSKSNRTCRCMR